MASPLQSPRKRRQVSGETVRRNLDADSADASLPTPSKTPRKASDSKTATNVSSFARNLFPADDLSAKTRRSKKYSGMTMDSFTAETEEENIEIFTDSRDRVPIKDDSEANPFFGKSAESSRRAKRRNIFIPGEGSQTISDAARRDDGMVYVFRGKKFFRKFNESEEEPAEEEEAGLSRSSIKPRLLFQDKTPEALEDEEATTDVEDNVKNAPATPTKTKQVPVETPASPPDSKRTARVNKHLDIGTPSKKKSRKSPFDSWPRIKDPRGQTTGKRVAEPIAETPAKRARA